MNGGGEGGGGGLFGILMGYILCWFQFVVVFSILYVEYVYKTTVHE